MSCATSSTQSCPRTSGCTRAVWYFLGTEPATRPNNMQFSMTSSVTLVPWLLGNCTTPLLVFQVIRGNNQMHHRLIRRPSLEGRKYGSLSLATVGRIHGSICGGQCVHYCWHYTGILCQVHSGNDIVRSNCSRLVFQQSQVGNAVTFIGSSRCF